MSPSFNTPVHFHISRGFQFTAQGILEHHLYSACTVAHFSIASFLAKRTVVQFKHLTNHAHLKPERTWQEKNMKSCPFFMSAFK